MLPISLPISVADVLVIAILSYGLVTIIRIGRPLQSLRETASRRAAWVSELLHCPLCLGFWVGGLWAWYYDVPGPAWCPCMVIGAAGSYVITVIVDRIDDRGAPPSPPPIARGARDRRPMRTEKLQQQHEVQHA